MKYQRFSNMILYDPLLHTYECFVVFVLFLIINDLRFNGRPYCVRTVSSYFYIMYLENYSTDFKQFITDDCIDANYIIRFFIFFIVTSGPDLRPIL